MPSVLRVARFLIAVLVIVALSVQYAHGSDRPTFSAGNFFSYFTVLGNILILGTLLALAVKPDLDRHAGFLVLRGTATLGIIATGLIYAVLLAPAAADVDVTLKWVDLVVHTLTPIVGLVDWLLNPPPRRITLADATRWLAFPVVWLVYTLIRGSVTDWYPYPFLDPDEESVGAIVVTCIAITVVFLLFAMAMRWWAGRRLATAEAHSSGHI